MNNLEDYFSCIRYITWDTEEYAFRFLDILTGQWYIRTSHE